MPGLKQTTDHRLVKASFRLEWYKMKPKKRHPRTAKYHTTTKPCGKISISSISDKEDENCRGTDRRYKHTTKGMAQHSRSLTNIW